MRQGAHRGLHDFGIESVGRIGAADDVLDAKPIRQPDDCPQIPRVLDAIEYQHEFLVGMYFFQVPCREVKQGQYVLRVLQEACPADIFFVRYLQFLCRDVSLRRHPTGLGQQVLASVSREHVCHQFVPFCHEHARLQPPFLGFQSMDVFDFVLAYHFPKLEL